MDLEQPPLACSMPNPPPATSIHNRWRRHSPSTPAHPSSSPSPMLPPARPSSFAVPAPPARLYSGLVVPPARPSSLLPEHAGCDGGVPEHGGGGHLLPPASGASTRWPPCKRASAATASAARVRGCEVTVAVASAALVRGCEVTVATASAARVQGAVHRRSPYCEVMTATNTAERASEEEYADMWGRDGQVQTHLFVAGCSTRPKWTRAKSVFAGRPKQTNSNLFGHRNGSIRWRCPYNNFDKHNSQLFIIPFIREKYYYHLLLITSSNFLPVIFRW
jgi:hypothetical protein